MMSPIETMPKPSSAPLCMVNAFIGLGSNADNPPQQLTAARKALSVLPEVQIMAASPIYRTEPQGKKDQPWFHNQVARLAFGPHWSATTLLDALLAVELARGRQRLKEERFGPRRIDLDLLLFGTELCNNNKLCLPHPRMFERAFVLVPLQDITPELTFPDGSSLRNRLATLSYRLHAGCIYQ